MEGRCFLSATPTIPDATSVQIGNTLYFADGNSGYDLAKSNLDGSDKQILVSGIGPRQLLNFHDTLYFTGYKLSSGEELWKSDGTVAGTMMVKDLYTYAASSSPHDFMIVNDQLYFLATNASVRLQLFTTDGTALGTHQVYQPASPGYTNGVVNILVSDNTVYFEEYNSANYESERFASGANSNTAIGLIYPSGELRVFGTTGDDNIQLSESAGVTTLSVNGNVQTFNNGDFTSLTIQSLTGNDLITVDPNFTRGVSISGGAGDDTIYGGAGNDTLAGNRGDNYLDGGAGNDSLFADDSVVLTAHNTLLGGDGDDTLNGGYGIVSLYGQAGNDTLITYEVGILDGGDGDDKITGGYQPETLTGGAGNDTLIGGALNDSLSGGDGNDSLDGGAGDDTLDGGAGHDTLFGNTGVDTFISNSLDTVTDSPSATLNGPNLSVDGTFGNDNIEVTLKPGDPSTVQTIVNGQVSEFRLDASQMGLTINAGPGNDTIFVDPRIGGTQTIYAGAGQDSITGGTPIYFSSIFGGDGDDMINGGGGGFYIDPAPALTRSMAARISQRSITGTPPSQCSRTARKT